MLKTYISWENWCKFYQNWLKIKKIIGIWRFQTIMGAAIVVSFDVICSLLNMHKLNNTYAKISNAIFLHVFFGIIATYFL